jgi:penicillin amidase
MDLFRDQLGIPHVRGKTVTDAFFGQGYAHAQDRWWQMCFDRRRAEGTLAEWLGPGRVRMDAFARRTGLASSARADYDALDAEAKAMCDAYAKGVNAWLATNPAPPREFELLGVDAPEWNPWDCGSVFKARHVLMGSYERKLWRLQLARELGTKEALDLATADGREDLLITGGREVWSADPGELATAGVADGSNNWAVHGSRTASGLPLLAGDPHRALEAPNVYYQNHIACDAFDAIGFSMAGVPGIFHFGHNADVAWCVTHAMADQQDLYVERFDDAGRYEFRGDSLEPSRRRETIAVRGGDDVEIDIVVTRHGPVVFGDDIAFKWTGTDGVNTTLNCLLPMLRAKTVDELDETMRQWIDPCNNFVMADKAGNIAYLHRGRVPNRPRANGFTPVPGWTGTYEWDGDVPFEALPRIKNPDEGYIVTANNRVVRNDYPYYLGMDYAARYRAERVLAGVRKATKATVADMSAVHADRVSIPAELFDAVVGEWNHDMQPDSVEAAIYSLTRETLAAMLCERDPLKCTVPSAFAENPLPSPVVYRTRVALPRLIEQNDRTLLDGDEWDELIAEAHRRAVAQLEERFGPDRSQWTWGRIHQTRTRHPVGIVLRDAAPELDPAPVSMGGDGECANCSGWESDLVIEHSSVARYVFDVGDWENSGWVVPLGASGDPGSAHYQDQAQSWSQVQLLPMSYDWSRIEAGAESVQRLR